MTANWQKLRKLISYHEQQLLLVLQCTYSKISNVQLHTTLLLILFSPSGLLLYMQLSVVYSEQAKHVGRIQIMPPLLHQWECNFDHKTFTEWSTGCS